MLIRKRETAKEVIWGVSVKVSNVWRKIQRVEQKCITFIKKTYCSEKSPANESCCLLTLLICSSLFYFVLGVQFCCGFLAPVQQPLVQAHCRAVCVIPQKSVSLSVSVTWTTALTEFKHQFANISRFAVCTHLYKTLHSHILELGGFSNNYEGKFSKILISFLQLTDLHFNLGFISTYYFH